MGGTYDPATYGARADGVADDRPALQAALDAAAANGGGLVTLAGPYAASFAGAAVLTVRHGVALRGINPAATSISTLGTPPAGAAIVRVEGDAAEVALEDLAIRGPYPKWGDYNSPPLDGILTAGARPLSGSLDLRRVRLSGCYLGVHNGGAASGNTNTIRLVSCDLQSYTAVVFPHQGRLLVRDCDIRGCGLGSVNGSTTDPLLNQCHGLYVYPGVDLDVADSRFADHSPVGRGFAVQVYGSAAADAGRYCRLDGCSIDGGHDRGILTNANRPTLISRCDIAGRRWAVSAQADCDLDACDFHGPGPGVVGYGKAAAVWLANCRFWGPGTPLEPAYAGAAWVAAGCRFPAHAPAQAATVAPGASVGYRASAFADGVWL